jgi:hypothetical protein
LRLQKKSWKHDSIAISVAEKGTGPLRRDWMARYREYDYSQGKLIQIQFEKQIVPGTSSSSGRNGNASRSAEIFNERSQQKERFLKNLLFLQARSAEKK